MISLALALATVAHAVPQWQARDGTAGLVVNERFAGLSIACAGAGVVRIVFSGFPGALEAGRAFTVTASVDGTAYLFRPTAEPGGTVFESVLSETRPLADVSGFLEALRRGRSVEISMPTGRYEVPLRGSSEALGPVISNCAG